MAPILDAPPLGPSTPSRGNALSRGLGLIGLRLMGWRVEGEIPDVHKAVIVVVPHTSNWDFIIGVLAMFALGVRVTFLGKHTLFRPPFLWIMTWLGGIPVDRSLPRGVVKQTVNAFERADSMILALSPEGTRSKIPRWRRGFYYIASETGVPIIPIGLDFGRRSLRIGPAMQTTSDRKADLEQLEAFFVSVRGRKHELATLNAL